jgi:hypothetical protein
MMLQTRPGLHAPLVVLRVEACRQREVDVAEWNSVGMPRGHMTQVREFLETSPENVTVRGFLHFASNSDADGLVLTHGTTGGGRVHAPVDVWSRFSWRSFLRWTAVIDACRERARAGGRTSSARLPAPSSETTGRDEDSALPESADAGTLCARHFRWLRHDWGDGGRFKAHPGAQGTYSNRDRRT